MLLHIKKFMKRILLIYLFIHSFVSCYSQIGSSVFDSLIIQEDINTLETYLRRKVRHIPHLSKYENIRFFHIFDLIQSDSTFISKKEYLDYSFVSRLHSSYSIVKTSVWSKRTRLINATSLVFTNSDCIVAEFHNGEQVIHHFEDALQGHKNKGVAVNNSTGFEICDFVYYKLLCKLFIDNKIQIAFKNGIEGNFISLSPTSTIVILNNKLLVMESDCDNSYLIPIDQYLKKDYFKISNLRKYPEEFIINKLTPL